jgi:RHS repeat-associated protein
VVQSIGLDALGRVTSASNPLDTFTYSYSDGTSRVTGVSSISGPTVALSYFGPTGDELLQQLNITTHTGGTSLAQFGFTYNADDNVKTLTVSSPSAHTTAYTYDTANRLVSALIGTGSPQYVFGYDHASNLLSITPNGPTQSFSYTATNSITSGTYDANGSPTVLSGNSYKWDGANRVVHFANSAANTASSFTYDGFGRLVRVVDTHGGTITADHSYTWCGSTRCLAHDNTQSGSPVSTQYFDQGAIVSGTPYYYVKDQLGSVTQLVTNTGTVASQYSYDPYGNRVIVSGTLVSDIGYAGYFNHVASGLEFALFRAYDPVHARWLNRDPIGEAGGVNLYGYTDGNPATYRDPTGRCPWCVAGAVIGGIANAYNNYNAYNRGQISGFQYFEDILVGAGTGALSGIPGLGFVGSAILGGLTGGANEGIQELVNGNVSCKKIGLATGIGVGAAALFGPLGEAIGNSISRPVIGSLVTSPNGYPVAGAFVGFVASAVASGLPLPDLVFPEQ